MKKARSIYFDEQTQKVRWTTTASENFIYDYKYVGEATENEFNILIDLLWYLHEEEKMSYNEFNKVYQELRYFCDRVMGLVDDL
jgi:hypothetical protein